MAKAICCDRCGHFEKVDKVVGWKQLDGGRPSIADPAGFAEVVALCPRCKEDFERFMSGPPR